VTHNLARQRAWKKANPDKVRAYQLKHNPRSAAKQYGLTVEAVRALFAAQDGKCGVCCMTTLYLDTETYSECDLKKAGTHRYAEHPSTEIMVAQWALDDDEPTVVDCTAAGRRPPDAARAACCSRTRHRDRRPQQRVRPHADPALLGHRRAGRALARHDGRGARARPARRARQARPDPGHARGPAEGQARQGADPALLQATPEEPDLRRATRDTHPKEWAEFLEYSRQDIVSMREIHRRCPSWNYQGGELALWHLDQRINDRGFAVDLDLARAAIAATDREKAG
jgi:DNA polymerase